MTYQELEKLVEGKTCPLHTENEKGEPVIIGRTRPGEEAFFKVTTYQNNGWTRTNYYWADGTQEELFDKTK